MPPYLSTAVLSLVSQQRAAAMVMSKNGGGHLNLRGELLNLGGGHLQFGGGLLHLSGGLLHLGGGLFKLGRKRFRLISTICQVPETMLAIDKIYCARVC